MTIHRLPEYLITTLKKGEIVERPASVLKELVENSLDAGADRIVIDIHEGGKTLISVEDNGSGIELSDMDMVFQHYTTSKIHGEQDIFALTSYGFRGEALANIAEISKTTMISKTAYSEIGTKIVKLGIDPVIKHQPVGFDHGTIVMVENIFAHDPEKLKSLKSSQTEFFYCYGYIVDIALVHREKTFVFQKNGKAVFDLQPKNSLLERMQDIYRKNRNGHIKTLKYTDEDISVYGIISDTQLFFGSMENIKLFVNKRPVQESGIVKAILDAYYENIATNEYPLAIVMIDLKPSFVDIHEDPKKLEIKFTDARKVYDTVYLSVKNILAGENVSPRIQSSFHNEVKEFPRDIPQIMRESGESLQDKGMGGYKVIGQLRNSYILVESSDALFYIDQYALAERIIFEKIKKGIKYSESSSSEILLQPIIIEIANIPDVDEKLDQIQGLGFDISRIGENKIAIYSVPQIFSMYKIDMEKIFHHVLSLETITFDYILDKIFATHACKVSIKAGDRLSLPEMTNLVKEGLSIISDLFVCQHGRPFFIKTPKGDIDKFFDR